MNRFRLIEEVSIYLLDRNFVELDGGVDDVPRWCRDGVCVELGFR